MSTWRIKDSVDENMGTYSLESQKRCVAFSRNPKWRSDLCWQKGCGHTRLIELKVPIQCSKHSVYQEAGYTDGS